MKIAPIINAINVFNGSTATPRNSNTIKYLLVHTGQHYDEKMSKLFFEDLGIPNPDINLEVGSSSHAFQTAEIMKRFENVCLNENPTHVLVVGDVNSTIACALVASKLEIKIIHVEAGLRSFDRSMPEEINRVLTDAISDYLFITEESAEKNLLREGIPKEKIYFVGNVMIDTLLKHRQKAQNSDVLLKLGLKSSSLQPSTSNLTPYGLLTLHRPSSVDRKEIFKNILEALEEIAKHLPLIFPAHPRTQNRIKEFGFEAHFNSIESNNPTTLTNPINSINLINPLGYLDFLQLMSNANLVLTDSGGIQEETTILGIPCVTIRDNTERPITVNYGTNRIVGTTKEKIIKGSLEAMKENYSEAHIPPLWDGKAAERIVKILWESVYLPRR